MINFDQIILSLFFIFNIKPDKTLGNYRSLAIFWYTETFISKSVYFKHVTDSYNYR